MAPILPNRMTAGKTVRPSAMDPRLHWTPEYIDEQLAGRTKPPILHDLYLGEQHKPQPFDVAELFTREELFRLAYVPFVIGELVWDYADTLCIMAAERRIDEMKPVSRFIKEQRVEYDRIRFRYIDAYNRGREINNGYRFEEMTEDIMSQCMSNLAMNLRQSYPDLPQSEIMFIQAVYQCKILGEALKRYLAKQTKMIEDRIKRKVGGIFPPQFFKLMKLVALYAGDKHATKRFNDLYDTYVATMANQMALIELNETADVEVSTGK